MIFLRNVLRAPARSLMTALGVAGGVALFVAITAITLDVRSQIGSAAGAYQLEVVVYERRANSPFTSRIGPAQMAALQAQYGPGLSPLVMGTHNEPWNAYALIVGVTPDFLARVPLTAGARYTEEAGHAMIGEIAAGRLRVTAGSRLGIDGREVTLTGVYRTGSRLLDGGVLMGIAEAQRVLTREGAEPQYSLAVVRGNDQHAAAALIADINTRFPALKAIPGTEFAGALRLLRVVDAFVKTISVLALVGTVIVVSNTLLMAIAERTRDLGILMTVGWTPWLVLRMLLAEGLLLCLVGAVAGNALALLLLRVVNNIDSIGFGWIPVRFPLALSAASLVMAAVVALLSLAWPAVVLWRIQPLAALRHE